jgi:hypothetical protein
MMLRAMMRALLLVPFSCAALYACSDDHETEPQPPSGYEDVVYEGTVTDEALTPFVSALEQGMLQDVASKAPTLDAPADAAQLPKSPIPTFTWHLGATASNRGMATDSRRAEVFLHPAGPERRSAGAEASILGPLAELFGPVRSAEAHGTPFTGTATWVVFSTPTDTMLQRVFTSELTHTPSQAAWETMVAAAAPITVTLVGGIFESNRLAADGGPFRGSATTFTIAP